MKKIFSRIKDFVKAHKDEQGFKYTVIIVALIIAAIAASEWRKWQDSKELPPTEIVEEAPVEEEKTDIFHKGKSKQRCGSHQRAYGRNNARSELIYHF